MCINDQYSAEQFRGPMVQNPMLGTEDPGCSASIGTCFLGDLGSLQSLLGSAPDVPSLCNSEV